MAYLIIKVITPDRGSYVAWAEDKPGEMHDWLHDFIVDGVTTEVLEYCAEDRDPSYEYIGTASKVLVHRELNDATEKYYG